jgi:hypothetical protein
MRFEVLTGVKMSVFREDSEPWSYFTLFHRNPLFASGIKHFLSFRMLQVLECLRFKVLAMVKMLILLSWVVMPCGLVGRHILPSCPEDGGIMFLWNIGVYLELHTSLQPRRSTVT